MSEAAEFAVDASVAPGRVLVVEARHESVELGGGGRSSGLRLWRLGPVAGGEAPMPANHGGGLHDQHYGRETRPVEGARQHGQDRSVRRSEPGALDPALEHHDLMA